MHHRAVGLLVCATAALVLWPPVAQAQSASPETPPDVVLIGVEGLTWPDVSSDKTPTLWGLLESGVPAATMSMYATVNSCDPDGWLTVSTGVPTTTRDGDSCVNTLPEATGRVVAMSRWDEIAALQKASPFHPELGRLSAELGLHGACLTAIGPGAAATTADDDGMVPHYSPTLQPIARDCAVSVVDAGAVTRTGGPEPADAAVADVIDAMPPGSTVIIFSVPSGQTPERAMGVAVEYRPGVTSPVPQYLTSPTTRWPGVVSLLDLPPTVFARLDLPTSTTWAGSPWTVTDGPADIESLIAQLDLIGARDNSLRSVTWFFLGSSVLVGLAVLVLLVAGDRWQGTSGDRARRLARSPRLASWLVALPVASFVVGSVPWWRSSSPVPALYLSVLAITAIVGELLLLLVRKRGVYWGSLLVTSALTTLVMVDVATGETLSRASPLAPSPLSGGRFYGLSNATSAAVAVAAVWSATLLAGWLMDRQARGRAVLLYGAVTATVILMTALPNVGADVGGAFTLLPTFAVTGIYLFRLRMTVWRTTLVLSACLLVPVVVALADYSRPAEDRTHLGRFVDLAVSGDAWDLVSRKAGYAAGSLLSLLSVVTVLTLVALAYQLFRLVSHRPLHGVWDGLRANRVLGAAVLGSWTAMVTGSVLNDYGIRMATIGLILLVPLLLLTLPHPAAFNVTPGRPQREGRAAPSERSPHATVD